MLTDNTQWVKVCAALVNTGVLEMAENRYIGVVATWWAPLVGWKEIWGEKSPGRGYFWGFDMLRCEEAEGWGLRRGSRGCDGNSEPPTIIWKYPPLQTRALNFAMHSATFDIKKWRNTKTYKSAKVWSSTIIWNYSQASSSAETYYNEPNERVLGGSSSNIQFSFLRSSRKDLED